MAEKANKKTGTGKSHRAKAILAPCNGLRELGVSAMMLRALNFDAEVIPCMSDGLLEFLEQEGVSYKEIYLVNVCFAGDQARFKAVLKKLKDARTKVWWMYYRVGINADGEMRYPIPMSLHEMGLLDYITDSGDECDVAKELQARFGMNMEDLDQFEEFFVGNALCVGNESYGEMCEAARWVYENYGWTRPFGEVVFAAARKTAADDLPGSLRETLEHYRRFKGRQVLGESPAMKELRAKIRRVAAFPDARVMILGESGTGKETVAMQIHYGSERRKNPFVPMSCATGNPQLVESRLFGFEKGAFTGADKQTKGVFETADGGTLFLDEIGELPLDIQATLLRALENRAIMRIGSAVEIPVNVRLVTATNRDLPQMVREGKFRADLYQRLCVVPMSIPPLRDHKEDIYEMIESWYALRYRPNRKCRRAPTEDEIEPLLEYDYPGNVRELHNMLERAEILGENDWAKIVREQQELNAGLTSPVADNQKSSLKKVNCKMPMAKQGADIATLDEAMRQYVRSAFDLCNKNATLTATRLGVSRNTVRKYLENSEAV